MNQQEIIKEIKNIQKYLNLHIHTLDHDMIVQIWKLLSELIDNLRYAPSIVIQGELSETQRGELGIFS